MVVLDQEGSIVRFNRACEQTSGYSFAAVSGQQNLGCVHGSGGRAEQFQVSFSTSSARTNAGTEYEGYLVRRDGTRRLIAWSSTMLPAVDETGQLYLSPPAPTSPNASNWRRLSWKSASREQRRIGQDLHDGLGQHLTGIAFMTKVQEQKLIEKGMPEAGDAAKIVNLVNEAIHKTRELARGLLPVLSDAQGLMSALQQLAAEVEDLFGISCRFQCLAPVLSG